MNCACWDLCGGRPVMGVPTAIHPNRSAWTPSGERHLIEAKRGKRLNVLAAMISNGELFSANFWETTTAAAFSGFLSLLHKHVAKPITVIQDNASIHKAKSERHIIEDLKKLGVTLYFLPPDSPELNKIERLWHKMKYTWMESKCRDATTLKTDIDEILSNFGSKFTFGFKQITYWRKLKCLDGLDSQMLVRQISTDRKIAGLLQVWPY